MASTRNQIFSGPSITLEAFLDALRTIETVRDKLRAKRGELEVARQGRADDILPGISAHSMALEREIAALKQEFNTTFLMAFDDPASMFIRTRAIGKQGKFNVRSVMAVAAEAANNNRLMLEDCFPWPLKRVLAALDYQQPKQQRAVRHKRSTQKGDAEDKLIAALTTHHEYLIDDRPLNQEPIGNNELARLAEVSTSTATAFFKKQFGGYRKYRTICRNMDSLLASLKLLNQAFSPYHLFGRNPFGEGDRDDD